MTDIVGISGSLRKGSYNTALLRAAAELVPAGTTLTIASLRDIPLYDADLDVEGGPPPVQELKRAVAECDGLLLATPEYNYGVSGVLKNAIDWVSRPAYKSVLAGKPVALIGASPGATGTARAHGQLKQVMLGTLSEVFPHPEVLVGGAKGRFSDGELTDEGTRKILSGMLEAFVAWIDKRG